MAKSGYTRLGSLRLHITDDALDVNVGTSVPIAATIADGANVTLGALADSSVAAGAAGSISAKLRRVTQALADLAALLAGTLAVNPVGLSFANILTQTTTTIKSGTGKLQRVIVNTPLALGVITIYDNTAGSGTKIGVITFPAAILTTGPVAAEYGVTFATGLTVVTAGANLDITVVYS